MVEPMKKSFEELRQNAENVKLVHWENIILNPLETIQYIASNIERPIYEDDARAIWDKIGFKNLTQAHKHNYREFGHEPNGHNFSLTNHHIDILRQNGFQELAKELDTEVPEYLDENKYNDFQKVASDAIERGEVCDKVVDRMLYWFAFQKTNINFKKFGFKTFGWRKYTKLERTNIEDDAVSMAIWDIFENEVQRLYKNLPKPKWN